MGQAHKTEIINPADDMDVGATNNYPSKGGKLLKVTDAYSNLTEYDYDGAGRQTTVTDALGNEQVTADYDDGNVKYSQQKNKIATDTYVTYSTAHWYDDDGREEAQASYGTGSPPGPWPASPPSSSDTCHRSLEDRPRMVTTRQARLCVVVG
jgi:YD repeat-containing protein